MTARTLGAALVALLAAFPVCSYGEVKINLKNSTSIIADECRDEGDRLVCYKMGGSFGIDKKDVLSTKNVSVPAVRTPEPAEAGAAGRAQKDEGKPAGAADGTEKQAAGDGAAKTADPRDEELRMSLQAEREALLRERQKLQEDIRNAPAYMPDFQFNELQRRNTELDERIKQFNEKAKRLVEGQKAPAASKK